VPPFVTMLGPWPQRALVLIALVPLGFVLVLLPWRIAALARPRARFRFTGTKPSRAR
jgi:hypothetical protein